MGQFQQFFLKKHPWPKKIKFVHIEGPNGDNNKIAKIPSRNLKISSSKTTGPILILKFPPPELLGKFYDT